MKKNEDLVLLCRYLIEENSEAFVIVDMERRQKIDCIRSIFKTLVGEYNLLSTEQQESLYNSISLILSKYEKGLRD